MDIATVNASPAPAASVQRGSAADLLSLRAARLDPVTRLLRKAAPGQGAALEVAAVPGPWGPCSNCSRTPRGVRERLAPCVLRVPRDQRVDLGEELRPVIGDPLTALSCRSAILARTHPSRLRGSPRLPPSGAKRKKWDKSRISPWDHKGEGYLLR